MRICHFTNTFLPHVGGVARSVQTLLEDLRRGGHRVLVVAPEFPDGTAPHRIERSVVRVPALQRFNGSDFSVRLPLGTTLSERLAEFQADVVHAHHPFLLGDTALRFAAQRGVPVIFTHHTLYEQYTHYVPFDSVRLKEFVVELSTRFANRCQGVIAPSESIAQLIKSRGVTVPVAAVPTGIDTASFAKGDGRALRERLGAAKDAVFIGHLGRLAPEKNLDFLSDALVRCLRRAPQAHFLVVGEGPSREAMVKTFLTAGVADRVHYLGKLTGRALVDAYAAMDLFAFASQSETQGMVLAEAMSTSCPVIALDANGVREIVRDRVNGRLLPATASAESFARALVNAVREPKRRAAWSAAARALSAAFDRKVTAARVREFYGETVKRFQRDASNADAENRWDLLMERIAVEGRLMADKFGAAVHALTVSPDESPSLAAS